MTSHTRRTFLKRSAQLAASLVVVDRLRCPKTILAARPGDKMKFGLVTYLWASDWDLPTLIRNCEKTGVLGVEVRTTHAHGVEPSLDAKQRREVKKQLADSPVTLLGPGSNERFDHSDPADLARAIEATKMFLKLSHDVGGTGVKVKPNSFHPSVPREKTIEQIGRSLNTLGVYAADHGQEVRLEVHGQCAELPIIRRIMDIANHPHVGVCWNSNAQDLKGQGLIHNFSLVKHRFGRTAHVRELNGGTYPYPLLIQLFVEMNYDGWILLEASTNPPDRVSALREQRLIFERLVAQSR